MNWYTVAYRLRFTPWDRYREEAAAEISSRLDAVEQELGATRSGRALDLGCGRGRYTCDLASRGWSAVGVDNVPEAIDAARSAGCEGASFVVGDVTDLPRAVDGPFRLFLDVGCFQGLDERGRLAYGQGVTSRAADDAVLLLLAFGRTTGLGFAGGVSPADVRTAFPDWGVRSVRQASTQGLGWPMSRMRPAWYLLGRDQG